MQTSLELERLTSQQSAIIKWFRDGSGALQVIARAGTGKTFTSMRGLADAPEAERSCALAFNKRIAKEMETRAPGDCRTINSLGQLLLKKAWPNARLDNNRGMRIATDLFGEDIVPRAWIYSVRDLSRIAKHVNPFADQQQLKKIAARYGISSRRLSDEQLADYAYQAMQVALNPKDGSFDYDDQLYIPIREDLGRPMFDLVLVDEAQDLDAAKISVAQSVLSADGRFVYVGDPYQTIYQFSGSSMETMSQLQSSLSATTLPLTASFRCPLVVIEYAQKLVADITAAPGAKMGSISKISDHQEIVQSALPGDFVLSRTNAPLMPICLALLGSGMPSYVEGRDIGRSLKAIVQKQFAESMKDLFVKMGRWKEKEIELAQRKLDPDDAAIRIEEIEDQRAVIATLSVGVSTIEELIEKIGSMFKDTNKKRSKFVVCSTVHKAKGLEADRVFILRSTLYPGGRYKKQDERNIEYVAVTRAKQQLIWVGEAVPPRVEQ